MEIFSTYRDFNSLYVMTGSNNDTKTLFKKLIQSRRYRSFIILYILLNTTIMPSRVMETTTGYIIFYEFT